MYTVTKYTHRPQTCPAQIEVFEAETWTAASTAAMRMGAVPSTGRVNGRAFDTNERHTYVALRDTCAPLDLDNMDRLTIEAEVLNDAGLFRAFNQDDFLTGAYSTEEIRDVIRNYIHDEHGDCWNRGLEERTEA